MKAMIAMAVLLVLCGFGVVCYSLGAWVAYHDGYAVAQAERQHCDDRIRAMEIEP